MLLFNRSLFGALTFFLCLWLPSSARAQYEINGPLDESISIREHASLVDCGDADLNLKELASSDLKRTPLSEIGDIGFTTHYYWVEFSLKNTTDKDKQLVLETARPIIDHVDLYLVTEQGDTLVQRSGDAIPFDQKSVAHRKSAFYIDIEAQTELKAFIHIKSDGEALQIPLYIQSPKSFLEYTYKEQIFYGIFYGILLLAAIIYIFFYFGMRDLTFIFYGAYVVFIALMQFSIDGMSHQYLISGGGYLNDRIVLITALIAGFFLGKYGETFLHIKKHSKVLYTLFNIAYIGLGISLVSLLFIPSFLPLGYPTANGLGLLVLVLLISSVITLKTKRVAVDPYFMAGVAFLMMGFVVFILNNFNYIPHSFFSENGPKFGTGLEVIFLSLSMSNRIKQLRLKNEENQRLALQRSEDMNEIKSSFISNISHELRTPLNLIMGMTTTLKAQSQDKGLHAKYDHILDSSESLLHLIEDILNFTEVEKGNQKLNESDFDLLDLIGELQDEFETRAKQKGLSFELITDEVPAMLYGDKEKLYLILEHLLDNAIKFTNSGFVSLTTLAITKNKRSKISFEISDSGEGIPESKMNTIFESFTKRSFKDKREHSGLGLGLYLAKTFVDLQGGEITLKNNQTGGVTCTVTLDYDVVSSDEGVATETAVTMEDTELNILYVEDNEMNQMVLKMMISQQENMTITIANHGKEGIEQLKEKKFDLVLMDLQMPVMDGFETTKAIREGGAGLSNLNIPIIAVTADITDATRKKVLDLGANDYTTKPVKAEVLFDKIWRLVQYQGARR